MVDAFARRARPAQRPRPTPLRPVATQLLHATREPAIDGSAPRRRLRPTSTYVGPAAHARHRSRAFERLPERWRSVLWLREVEEPRPRRHRARSSGLTEESTEQLGDAGPGRAARAVRAGAAARRRSTPTAGSTTVRLSGYVAARSPRARCRPGAPPPRPLRGVPHPSRRGRRPRPAAASASCPALPIAIEALAAEAWLARDPERQARSGLRLPERPARPGVGRASARRRHRRGRQPRHHRRRPPRRRGTAPARRPHRVAAATLRADRRAAPSATSLPRARPPPAPPRSTGPDVPTGRSSAAGRLGRVADVAAGASAARRRRRPPAAAAATRRRPAPAGARHPRRTPAPHRPPPPAPPRPAAARPRRPRSHPDPRRSPTCVDPLDRLHRHGPRSTRSPGCDRGRRLEDPGAADRWRSSAQARRQVGPAGVSTSSMPSAASSSRMRSDVA